MPINTNRRPKKAIKPGPKATKPSTKPVARDKPLLGNINLARTGPITVVDGFTYEQIPTRFLKTCVMHTLGTNKGEMLRPRVENGPEVSPGRYAWQMVSFEVTDPATGEEWFVTRDPEIPRHFCMVPSVEQRAHEQNLKDRADYLGYDPSKFD